MLYCLLHNALAYVFLPHCIFLLSYPYPQHILQSTKVHSYQKCKTVFKECKGRKRRTGLWFLLTLSKLQSKSCFKNIEIFFSMSNTTNVCIVRVCYTEMFAADCLQSQLGCHFFINIFLYQSDKEKGTLLTLRVPYHSVKHYGSYNSTFIPEAFWLTYSGSLDSHEDSHWNSIFIILSLIMSNKLPNL